MSERVCIIVVNWNGWRDTAGCLESVLRNGYHSYQIVVCDNHSTDKSIARLKAWARGELKLEPDPYDSLARLTWPPISKPVPYVEAYRARAEGGGQPGWENVPLVFIHNGDNLGFAGGCNVGIEYALASKRFDYCWLLNNDTVIEPDALVHMVTRMGDDPNAGVCGSTVLEYHSPNVIQSLGGARYNQWTGIARCIGEGDTFELDSVASRVVHLDYVNGASLLMHAKVVRAIGLMDARYFLYWEEVDWCVRARRQFDLVYAPRSIVYHKRGGSTGASTSRSSAARLPEYYMLYNRLVFTRLHHPRALPTVYLTLALSALKRALRGQWRRVVLVAEVWLRHMWAIIHERWDER